MTEKLEKLIALAVTDGVITDRELEILKKKAKEEGVDEDELEMLLDVRLYERKEALKEDVKNSIPPPPIEKPRSNKEGDLKKCPSCGAPVQSFNTKCSDCGHEFSNTKSNVSIERFFEQLNELEKSGQEESLGNQALGSLLSTYGLKGDSKLDKQKKSIIANFPIPNTKGDILEFLTIAIPKTKSSGGFFTKNQPPHKVHNDFIPVWKTKCEQIIIKARFSMKEDKSTLAEIEHYAKELKIK